MDAPEVDSNVYLSDDFDAKPGDQIWVQIIHAAEYDVWGARVEDQCCFNFNYLLADIIKPSLK